MTVLEEAVARYHRLLDTPAYRDLAWAKSIQEKMTAHNLAPVGRPVCPVLRPHFVSRRQMAAMAKAAESLYSAMDRMGELALSTPAVLSRMDMLPGEKMLATLSEMHCGAVLMHMRGRPAEWRSLPPRGGGVRRSRSCTARWPCVRPLVPNSLGSRVRSRCVRRWGQRSL